MLPGRKKIVEFESSFQCVDWAKGVRECFSIREKMDRKFGSNLLESRLDVDSATSAHKLQDSFADPRKGNARASTVNGKSINGNPSDHRTAAVDVPNTAKVAGEGKSLRCRHCNFWKVVKISEETV